MRIALSDDPWPLDRAADTTRDAARVLLDDDRHPGGCTPCAGPDSDSTLDGPAMPGWHLRLRQRTRQGFDPEGNELYGWVDVWAGEARVTSTNRGLALNQGRQETSDATGTSFATVTAMLVGVGDLEVTETAVAWDDDARRWEITAVEQTPGGVRLDLERVADDAA